MAVAQMRARGIPTERGDWYDRIETANNNICQILDKIQASELATCDAEQKLAEFTRAEADRQGSKVVTGIVTVTHLEIPKTTDLEVAPRKKRDREQECKDANLLLVAAEYPDLKKTPEYQAAARRSAERYARQLKSISQQQTSPLPEPQIKKWEPTRTQDTAPNLTRSIEELANRVGLSFKLGNYAISICDDQIDVVYKDALTLTIDERQTQLIGDRPQHTIDQHERSLIKAIDLELDRLGVVEAKHADRLLDDREVELQQAIQLEREIDQKQSDNIDFSDDIPNVHFETSSPDRDRDQYRNFQSR